MMTGMRGIILALHVSTHRELLRSYRRSSASSGILLVSSNIDTMRTNEYSENKIPTLEPLCDILYLIIIYYFRNIQRVSV